VTRRFVILGQTALASPHFSLTDLAGTSGRLDVLLRCLRAALLVSHGLRRDTIVYLVLGGGPDAPRVLRVDGRFVRFVRPDERQLALLVQKALARVPTDSALGAFVEVRAGLAVARGGLEAVLSDLGDGPLTSLVLEEGARDLREALPPPGDLVVFVGDHRGFAEEARARLAALGAVAVGVGPVSVHADDAITLVCNELDRRDAGVRGAPP
jgi:tRNA (pseudouridine54-N1)-methyltransferase